MQKNNLTFKLKVFNISSVFRVRLLNFTAIQIWIVINNKNFNLY